MTPRAQIMEIVRRVGESRRIPPEVILSPCRIKAVVEARHEAIREARETYPHFSTPRLGRMFQRDHTTILYALGRLKGKGPKA